MLHVIVAQAALNYCITYTNIIYKIDGKFIYISVFDREDWVWVQLFCVCLGRQYHLIMHNRTFGYMRLMKTLKTDVSRVSDTT